MAASKVKSVQANSKKAKQYNAAEAQKNALMKSMQKEAGAKAEVKAEAVAADTLLT